jgi:hypothetical protein
MFLNNRKQFMGCRRLQGRTKNGISHKEHKVYLSQRREDAKNVPPQKRQSAKKGISHEEHQDHKGYLSQRREDAKNIFLAKMQKRKEYISCKSPKLKH